MAMQIVIYILCIFIGALISYFVTTLTTRNIQKAIAKEITLTHEQVHHKKAFDHMIDKHMTDCPSAKDHDAVRTSLIFLVDKAGGNLHELGLS